jgi:hypothetical protein
MLFIVVWFFLNIIASTPSIWKTMAARPLPSMAFKKAPGEVNSGAPAVKVRAKVTAIRLAQPGFELVVQGFRQQVVGHIQFCSSFFVWHVASLTLLASQRALVRLNQ